MTCLNLKSPNLFMAPKTTKLQILFATFVKLMTFQVELRGSRLIANNLHVPRYCAKYITEVY